MNLNRKFGQKKKVLRRHRNVGLGFKTPREVCVFHDFACWWVVAAWLVMGEDLQLMFTLQGMGRCLICTGNSVVGLGAVSCYMHGGFDTSGFASVMLTLVLFQLCVDRFESLRSLTDLKFSKTLLVDLQKSAGHLIQVNPRLYI